YFTAKASFLWLLGLEPGEFSTMLFGIVSNILLVLSMIYFTRSLNLDDLSRIAFILSFVMILFVFVLMSANLMHALSLSMLFFSLAYFMKGNDIISGVMLGASSIVHPFSLALFPFLAASAYLAHGRKFEKRMAYPIVVGFLIFAALYYRVFLSLGMPYQNAPDKWGYLLHWGADSLITEFMFLLPVILVAAWFNRDNRKLVAFFVILLALYSFVSFRLNIALAFTGGLMVSRWIKGNRHLSIIVIAIMLVNVIPVMYIMSGFHRPCDDIYLTEECLKAMDFLSYYSSESNVMAPLGYGHIITGLAGLKSVADPYVEYSVNERLHDSIRFGDSEDISIARKWNASIVVTERRTCDRDLVYDNGYVSICWRK
ncbi:MAG: hypothetical protein QMD85_05435, partial [Candidatus Aenigmarchaeota archaeon]|nr:hypothetical protein [Candidatus Aenigmarchaeota archaeon]